MLKGLIEWVTLQGWTGPLYYGFQVLAFICVFIMAVWYGKKLKIGTLKSIVTFAVVYPLTDLWKRVLFWIESGFQVFGGENIVRIFVYVPVIAYFVAVFLKIERKKMCDFLAPLVILSHAVGHIGCIFAGCCQGYPMSWGLYNIQTRTTHFPTQPLESLVAFAILWYVLYRTKKHNYEPDGLQYPIMLAWFGGTRFLLEFLRDNEKIFLNISSLAIHAFFAFVVGVGAYIVMKNKHAVTTAGCKE